jgi:peptide/nickel transport system substrate-binding protein
MELLPWIPVAALNEVLITSSDLTGAPASFVYMGGPWANLVGGK